MAAVYAWGLTFLEPEVALCVLRPDCSKLWFTFSYQMVRLQQLCLRGPEERAYHIGMLPSREL